MELDKWNLSPCGRLLLENANKFICHDTANNEFKRLSSFGYGGCLFGCKYAEFEVGAVSRERFSPSPSLLINGNSILLPEKVN